MDWSLVARATLRYSVGAAGASVLLVALLTTGAFPLFVLMTGGLLCLLFAVGASDVRTTHDAGDGVGHEMQFSSVDASVHTHLPLDRVLIFYGVGLAVLSFAGMVTVARL